MPWISIHQIKQPGTPQRLCIQTHVQFQPYFTPNYHIIIIALLLGCCVVGLVYTALRGVLDMVLTCFSPFFFFFFGSLWPRSIHNCSAHTTERTQGHKRTLCAKTCTTIKAWATPENKKRSKMKSILRLTALTNWNRGLSGHKTASQNELASFWQIKQKGGCELFPIKLLGGKCSHRPWLSKASQSLRIRPRHLYPLWCTALIEVNKESLKAHPWRRRKEWFNKKTDRGRKWRAGESRVP